MICTRCQAPNPDPSENCLSCGFVFDGPVVLEESAPAS